MSSFQASDVASSNNTVHVSVGIPVASTAATSPSATSADASLSAPTAATSLPATSADASLSAPTAATSPVHVGISVSFAAPGMLFYPSVSLYVAYALCVSFSFCVYYASAFIRQRNYRTQIPKWNAMTCLTQSCVC